MGEWRARDVGEWRARDVGEWRARDEESGERHKVSHCTALYATQPIKGQILIIKPLFFIQKNPFYY